MPGWSASTCQAPGDGTEYGLRPVGFLDADPLPEPERPAPRLPVLGARTTSTGPSSGPARATSSSPSPPSPTTSWSTWCAAARRWARGLARAAPVRVDQRPRDLEHVGGMPLMGLRTVHPQGLAVRGQARARPRGRAVAADRCLAPLMAPIALAVRLSSPGPVIFRQRRVGRDGTVFDLLKFRTMRDARRRRPSASSPAPTAPPGGVEGDDRRTRSGGCCARTSLDELPQLLQRAARRHEPRRPAPRAARVRRALRDRHPPLRRPPPRQVRHDRLGAGPRAARPDVARRPGRVGQLLHRATGRCGWT